MARLRIRLTSIALWPLLVLLVAAQPAPSGAQDVTVEKKPPTAETITFPPGNPPQEVVLNPGEEALCRSNFGVDVRYRFRYNARPVGQQVAVRLHSLTFTYTLTLAQTIYLPDNAPPQLVAHEQGHADIAEAVYAEAERIAREVAEEVKAKTWQAAAEDEKAAAQKATDEMFKMALNEYVKRTADVTTELNRKYDDLTDHGRKAIASDEAVRQVLKDTPFERPSTRPAE